jgi:hypothetical protein
MIPALFFLTAVCFADGPDCLPASLEPSSAASAQPATAAAPCQSSAPAPEHRSGVFSFLRRKLHGNQCDGKVCTPAAGCCVTPDKTTPSYGPVAVAEPSTTYSGGDRPCEPARANAASGSTANGLAGHYYLPRSPYHELSNPHAGATAGKSGDGCVLQTSVSAASAATQSRLTRFYLNGAGTSADYSRVTGRLSYVHTGGGAWVVRYAPIDCEDLYGGSVVLAHVTDLDTFKDGDLVAVEGKILDDGRRGSKALGGARYRASIITLIERPARAAE